MKSVHFYTLAIAAALMIMSGTFSAAQAGRRVARDADVASVPAPIVDDTPINPDTAVKIKPPSRQKNILPDNLQPKKRIIKN